VVLTKEMSNRYLQKRGPEYCIYRQYSGPKGLFPGAEAAVRDYLCSLICVNYPGVLFSHWFQERDLTCFKGLRGEVDHAFKGQL
jgi:hypothetical protein